MVTILSQKQQICKIVTDNTLMAKPMTTALQAFRRHFSTVQPIAIDADHRLIVLFTTFLFSKLTNI